jgi:hypothetical protein
MEFFNKKEEVIEMQLTEYGKYLLSLGALNPSYFAFFDDEILYDDKYADGAEIQNKADQRIRFETPALKVISNRSGAQTRVDEFLSNVTSSNWQVDSDPADKIENFTMQQPFEDVTNIAAFPLGTSDLTSRHDAAWSVNLLNKNVSTISSSLGYMVSNLTSSVITGSTNGIINDIPQLDINLDYQIYFAHDEDPQAVGPLLPSSSAGDPPLRMGLIKNFLVLDILEKNSVFETENFDIEVYHVSTDNKMTQLNFLPDDDQNIVAPVSLTSGEPANVEYYMNLYRDENIPAEILNTVGLTRAAVLGNANRLNIVRDLYTTDNEEPC